ncbi:MAG: aryl-sulfate sulfotransferase, partial [Planctomycetota bacterium]
RVRTASRQSEIREYDLLGNRLAAWHAEGAISSPGSVLVEGVNIFHHDQQRLPNGNYLVLDQADVTIDNFPTSDADRHAPTESRIVRQDVIHEFTPAGEVINSWSLLEMLDPVRIGYGVVKEPPAPQDWSHSNAVVYDASDDSIIVSVRHQDAVIKFDKSTGDLKWILGTHEAWGPQFRPYLLTPIGGDDFEWPFHTHSPQILPDDPSAPHGLDDLDKLTLLIHDNGNNRAIPFDPALPDEENYTRAVEYRINEQDMTIEQTWAYGKDAEQILYSPTAGDADWMPVTNNVLIGFAGPTFIDGESQPGRNAHIVEVDRSGKVVFQLVLSHPSDESTATITYRAERVPSLYDGSEYIATEITGLDGDFNGDRFVDGADLIRWQRFRDPTESLSPWETGFGTALQQESTTEIPEPPSVGLLAVMLLGCIVRQRRRGQTGPRPYVGQRMMSTSK